MHIAEDIELHGVVAELFGLANTLPSLNWLRCLPTEFAHRSLSERHAQEFLHTVLFETFENAILGFYLKGDCLPLLL